MKTGACAETEGLLQALVDGALTAPERASVEGHLAECPACTGEAARLRDNAAFLQEVLAPFRMPADLPRDFLLRLPRKDPRHRAAPAPAAAPRTTVLGDARPRRRGRFGWVAALGIAGAAAFAGWLFLRGPGEEVRRERARPLPDVKPRPEEGKGPADPRRAVPVPPETAPGAVRPPGPGRTVAPPGGEPLRSAADLAAALRGVQGDRFAPVVQRGWDLLAGSSAEAKAARELVSKEKDARVRAGLALCLGADAGEETRAALRGLLADESPEVRAAAALALVRSLTLENPAKKGTVQGLPPLLVPVPVAALPEDPGRADLVARLAAETDPAVRRVLVQVLGPTAGSDASVRDRLLEGVKGAYGDDLRESCVKSLQGVQDPALVPAFAEALAQPGTPKSLHAALLEGMIAADARAAAEALGDLIPRADSPDLRRELVAACARAGGASAQKALLDVLSGDQDGSVRVAAVRALERYPAKEVLEALDRAARDDADQTVRQEAERVGNVVKASLHKAEGGQEAPRGENPPPAPPPAPAGDGQ